MRHAERGPLEVLRNEAGTRLGGDVGFRPITTSCCVRVPACLPDFGEGGANKGGLRVTMQIVRG